MCLRLVFIHSYDTNLDSAVLILLLLKLLTLPVNDQKNGLFAMVVHN